MRRSTVFAIIAAALAVMLSTGIRQSFGLFVIPVSESLGTGRETYSLAIAWNSVIYGLPIVGIIADRIGSRIVLLAGGILYVVGLGLWSIIDSSGGLYLSVSVMIGIALSATSYVVVLGAVAQLVPPETRSRSFGVITAAGSSGMFVVPPLAKLLLDTRDWRFTMIVLAVIASVIILLGLVLPKKAKMMGDSAEIQPSFLKLLNSARKHNGYLLLVAGFFVCGFHVAFVATHLPPYLTDKGFGEISAVALSLIGVFNLIGSYLFGWLGDFYRKKYLLSLLYFLRAIVFALFLFIPLTRVSGLVFASAIGFLWLATVPLTSGTVAQIFGSRNLSTMFGIVFFSHQIGAFLGVWLGGLAFDTLGTYDPIWYASIVLGIVAAVIHLPMTDEPIASQVVAKAS